MIEAMIYTDWRTVKGQRTPDSAGAETEGYIVTTFVVAYYTRATTISGGRAAV